MGRQTLLFLKQISQKAAKKSEKLTKEQPLASKSRAPLWSKYTTKSFVPGFFIKVLLSNFKVT